MLSRSNLGARAAARPPLRRWRRQDDVERYDELFSEPAPPPKRDSVRRRLLAVADVLALVAGFLATWWVTDFEMARTHPQLLAIALPFWVVLNKLLGLYDRDANLIHKSTLDEIPMIGLSVVLGTSLTFMLFPGLFGVYLGRSDTLVFIALALVTTGSFRALVRYWVVRNKPPERCLIVGSGFVAELLARKITAHPEYGVELVGFADTSHDAARKRVNGQEPEVGDLDRFEDLCRQLAVERVVIGFSSVSHEELMDVIRSSKTMGLKISVVPRLFEVIGHAVEVDQLEGTTLLGLRGFSRTRSSLKLKRLMDVTVAAAVLVVTTPMLLIIAAAIKLTSRGPVLFRQQRIGRRNEPFQMYKFRTMFHGADELKAELAHLNEADGPMFKLTDDPRCTSIGRFLRRTSLDELPQLLNVLKGEMSLVGPRPLVPDEDDHVIGYHRERLDLTPGLTGTWQVLGRTAIPFHEMVKLDYLYVAEWSLWNDIKLLIRTAPLVVQARGR